MKSARILFAALAATALAALPAAAKTYYVSTTGTSTATGTADDPLDIATGFGKAWNNANEIVIGPGTYEISESLALSGDGAVIRGATGNPRDVVIDAKGQCPVMRLAGGVLVHSLTVTNGVSATLDDTAKNASGIRLGSDSSTAASVVSNCVVTACDNTLGEPGGAVVIFGNGLLVDSVVCGNTGTKASNTTGLTSAGAGAGVNVAQSGGQIVRCTIRDNTTASHGAGVCIGTASSLTIKDSLITNNVSKGAGGGISLRKSGITLALENCEIVDNQASGSYGGGLAIYTGDTVVAKDCTFSGNSATYGGAVRLYGNGAALHAEGCTFADNTDKTNGGGAVYLQYGTAFNATNSVFSGNSGPDGGAVYFFENSTFTAIDCSFAGNAASLNGGAVSFASAGTNKGGTFNATGCSFSENRAAASGGSVYVPDSATFAAVDCSFGENTAQWGGAVTLYRHGRFAADGCTFMGNSATDTTKPMNNVLTTCGGGAIMCSNTTCDGNDVWGGCWVSNSVFTANSSTSAGGAVSHSLASAAVMEFVNCKFFENTGVYWGGAACLVEKSGIADRTGAQECLFRQCLFAGNKVIDQKTANVGDKQTVANGGAIYFVDNFSPSIDSCTFAGNTAESSSASAGMGGAVYHKWGGSITNSVIAGNKVKRGSDVELTDDSTDWGYAGANYNNCVYPDSNSKIASNYFKTANGNIHVDPLFVDAANGDYRLSENSPCRGRGLNEAWMLADGAQDLAGLKKRIYGENVDIGAYEIYIPAAFTMVIR